MFLKDKTLGLFVKTNGEISKYLYSGLGFILAFHRITEQSDRQRVNGASGLEISPEKITDIVDYYRKKGFAFISMDELCDGVQKKKKIKKVIAFTLDDGYIDNFTVAYPLLTALNVPFTVYIANAFPDKKALLWWYLLEDKILNAVSQKEVQEETFVRMRESILDHKGEIRTFLKDKYGVSDEEINRYARELSMDWAHIIEMSAHPLVTIGAHSMDHLALSTLSEEEMQYQILESKNRIEAVIGKKVEHFAYPYGSVKEWGMREVDAVRKAGFTSAVTLLQGNVFKGADMCMLPRIPLGEHVGEDKLKNITKGIHHFAFNGFRKSININQ